MVQRAVSTRRQGMVLLIVMALLSMVGLTAVTFLLTTGQLRDASEQNRQMGENTVDPDSLLQDAVMQVIRGTDNADSEIFGESLLEDVYGTQNPQTRSLNLTCNSSLERGMLKFSGGGNDSYVGAVLTCIDEDSACNGLSTVILKNEGGVLYALPLPDGRFFDSESRKYMVNQLPFQSVDLDFDAPLHDRFLAVRNPQSGKIVVPSYLEEAELNSLQSSSTSPYTLTSLHGEGTEPMVDADNDGFEDSRWLDLGMPVFTAKDGTRFKPFFGIVVEDMDGRLNVNASGNRTNTGSTAAAGFISRGFGPLEIAWEKVLGSNVVNGLYSSRFGKSGTPDDTATHMHKGNWYQSYVDTITDHHVQRQPMDILGNLSYSVTSGEPTFSTKENFVSPNGYDLDLGSGTLSGPLYDGSGTLREHDQPFSPSELEAVIRRYDFDSQFLPNRLKDELGLTSGSGSDVMARLITTDSWHIPAIRTSLLDGAVKERLLPEVLAGWPVDLLRAATFNANDTWDGTKYPKRHAFMQCLYEIMKARSIDMGGSGETVEKRRAQWCANVVDFLDPDSIMTPFKPEGETFTVYGCEQPEVLISETFAYHSRNTEKDVKLEKDLYVGGKFGSGPKSKTDTTVYENYPLSSYRHNGKELEPKYVKEIKENIEKLRDRGYGPDGKNEFDQYVRPQGGLFIELYNPWDASKASGRPIVNGDIYANGTRAVDLSKTVGDGKSVWRVVVMNDADTPQTDESENSHLKRDETTDEAFDSRIYRTAYFAPSGNLNSHEFAASTGGNLHLEPGKSILIGPEGESVLKFEDPGNETDATQENQGDSIIVEESIRLQGRNCTFKGISGTATGLAIKAKENGMRFSLTEEGNYGPDNSLNNDFTISRFNDKPLDQEAELTRLGTELSSRRMVHLQRLADPTRAYSSTDNPYITVDSMIVDLTVFNARTDQNEEGVTGANPNSIVTRKREQKAYLWEQDASKDAQVNTNSASGSMLDNSFDSVSPLGGEIPMKTWLGWINRPAVSPFELMNVTNRSASELLYFYDPTDEGIGFEKNYGFLPKFSEASRREIFGFMRIPSPQTVTPMVLNMPNINGTALTDTADLPFAYYSMYREPGKINLNTISDYRVLSALLGKDIDSSTFSSKWPNTAQKPFRSIANLPAESVLRDSDFLTFLQNTDSSVEDPSERINLYRLANLTTTRSNVFAVWITMGFFEVDSNGEVVTYNSEPYELGTAAGEVKRYRSFYLIDRSIPVGFERGKNWNSDRVILLKRMLQ